MMNFRKSPTPGVSLIAMASHSLAAAVLAAFGMGQLMDRPVGSIMPRDLMLPGSPYLPRNKHGCCKRGGRSKRARGLDYWRR